MKNLCLTTKSAREKEERATAHLLDLARWHKQEKAGIDPYTDEAKNP